MSFLVGFLIIFDFKFLAGTNDFGKGESFYIRLTDHSLIKDGKANADIVIGMVGGNYYIQENWHFPLLISENVSQPERIPILFKASIPLMAIFFKIVASITSIKISYFGILIFLSYLSLFFINYKIMALVFQRDSYLFLLASALVLFQHIAYFGFIQALNLYFFFLIYLNFYWYLYCHRNPKKGYFYFSLSVILALLTEIYFCAMTMVFYLSLGLYLFIKNKKKKHYLINMVSTFLACLFLMFILGYFSGKPEINRGWGYGRYPTYLLKFLTPGFLNTNISFLLLLVFGFLGSAYLKWKGKENQMVIFIKQYKAVLLVLVIAVLLLLGFSLSDHIHLSEDLVLFKYTIPFFLKNIFYQFRATSRFSWPLTYLMTLATLIFVLKTFNKKLSMTLLLLVLVFQVQKTIPKFIDGIKNHKPITQKWKAETEKITQFKREFWKALLDEVNKVRIYPSYMTGMGPFDVNPKFRTFYINMELLSSLRNLPINSSYTSRNLKNRVQEFKDATIKTMEDGTLYCYNEQYFHWLRTFTSFDFEKHFKKIVFTNGFSKNSPLPNNKIFTNTMFIGMKDFKTLENLNKRFGNYLKPIDLGKDGVLQKKVTQYDYDFIYKNKLQFYKKTHFSEYSSVEASGYFPKNKLYMIFNTKEFRPSTLSLTYVYPVKKIPKKPFKNFLKEKGVALIERNTFLFPNYFKKKYERQRNYVLTKNGPKKIDLYLNQKFVKTVVFQHTEKNVPKTLAVDLLNQKMPKIIKLEFRFHKELRPSFYFKKIALE